MPEFIRYYSIAVSVLVILIGTYQIRSWWTFRNAERIHWLSTASLNLAMLIGSIEAQIRNLPIGPRNYLVALALTWLLAAVIYPLIERHRAAMLNRTDPKET